MNAARISIVMMLQSMLAGFLKAGPHVHIDLTNDECLIDIVECGFDARIRTGENVHRDIVAVPISEPIRFAVVASPAYLNAEECTTGATVWVRSMC